MLNEELRELWPIFPLSSTLSSIPLAVSACKLAVSRGDGPKSATWYSAGSWGRSWWPGYVSFLSSFLQEFKTFCLCVQIVIASPLPWSTNVQTITLTIVLLLLHGRILLVCFKKLFFSTFSLCFSIFLFTVAYTSASWYRECPCPFYFICMLCLINLFS